VRVLALALGNPLLGDDGAGAAMARGLEAVAASLEVIEAIALLPEHAERVAEADGVLFLDASVASAPGAVHVRPVAAGGAGPSSLLHALLPEELLGLARALHGRAPPAAVISIGAGRFAPGEGLSPEVEAALPEARAQVWALRTPSRIARLACLR
jgi:hydrogenase maturation protease